MSAQSSSLSTTSFDDSSTHQVRNIKSFPPISSPEHNTHIFAAIIPGFSSDFHRLLHCHRNTRRELDTLKAELEGLGKDKFITRDYAANLKFCVKDRELQRLDSVEERGETDKKRGKVEHRLMTFLNSSTRPLSRSKSREGKKPETSNIILNSPPHPSRTTSRLPTHAVPQSKDLGVPLQPEVIYTHKAVPLGTKPADPSSSKSQPYSLSRPSPSTTHGISPPLASRSRVPAQQLVSIPHASLSRQPLPSSDIEYHRLSPHSASAIPKRQSVLPTTPTLRRKVFGITLPSPSPGRRTLGLPELSLRKPHSRPPSSEEIRINNAVPTHGPHYTNGVSSTTKTMVLATPVTKDMSANEVTPKQKDFWRTPRIFSHIHARDTGSEPEGSRLRPNMTLSRSSAHAAEPTLQRSHSSPEKGSRHVERLGRISPCLRLTSPKFLSREQHEGKLTPARVSSPILREKLTTASKKARRTTHGSFDFERPGSRNSSKSGYTESRSDVDERDLNEKTPRRGNDNLRAHLTSRRHEPTKSAKIKMKAPDLVPPLPTKRATLRHQDISVSTSHTSRAPPSDTQDDDTALPKLSSSTNRSMGLRSPRSHPGHPLFEFEPAALPPSKPFREGSTESHSRMGSISNYKGRQLGLGLAWAPTMLKENAILEGGDDQHHTRPSPKRNTSDGCGHDQKRPKTTEIQVVTAFKDALGDAGFATFGQYIRRFDAHIIPLDGPSGLITRVQKLLDASASSLNERRKRELIADLLNIVRRDS